MRWTGASERTVKNWISGSYGPTAEHLIELMRHSDTILNVVLGLSGRPEAMTMERIKAARDELSDVLEELDLMCGSQDGI